MGPAAATLVAPVAPPAPVAPVAPVAPAAPVAPVSPVAPPPHSDTDDDHLDALQNLGDEIATLSAHIQAATHRLLTLIAEFDRRRGWEVGGHRSCAHWLAFRTGIDRGAAREKVRAARALTELPEISEAMSRGELSFAKVRGPYCASLR